MSVTPSFLPPLLHLPLLFHFNSLSSWHTDQTFLSVSHSFLLPFASHHSLLNLKLLYFLRSHSNPRGSIWKAFLFSIHTISPRNFKHSRDFNYHLYAYYSWMFISNSELGHHIKNCWSSIFFWIASTSKPAYPKVNFTPNPLLQHSSHKYHYQPSLCSAMAHLRHLHQLSTTEWVLLF